MHTECIEGSVDGSKDSRVRTTEVLS